MGLLHPGKIIFVDGNTDQVVSTREAHEVPESARFAATPSGPVPVVRVVATVAGDRRFIREYGPNGELLRTTTQLRDAKVAGTRTAR